jgi:hypothetical protein
LFNNTLHTEYDSVTTFFVFATGISNETKVEGTEGPRRRYKCDVDRAKPRKSPHRPLPGIVTALLARNSSESDDSGGASEMTAGSHMIDEYTEISFENLQEFYDTVPQGIKDRKRCKDKRNGKKQQKKKVEKGMNICFPNNGLT